MPKLENFVHMLPNLIVIGAAKAGTTSLHRYLDLHPEIEMRPIFQYVRTGTGPKGKVEGEYRATGYLPSFLPLFIVMGLVKKGEPYL